MNKTLMEIDLSKLIPYKDHLFSIYQDEKLDELAESIKLHGILSPLIVRKYSFKGDYMILAGHNRAKAAEKAGLSKVPCLVCPDSITEAEEQLIAIESNFFQRAIDEIKPSELSKAVYKWYTILKKQGLRSDLLDEIEKIEMKNSALDSMESDKDIEKIFHKNSYKILRNSVENETLCPIGEKWSAAEIIAEKTKLSPRNIKRYLRVAQLTDELLTFVDSGAISLRAAVDLSYLTASQQHNISSILQLPDFKIASISMVQAHALRTAAEKEKLLTVSDIVTVIRGSVPQKVKKVSGTKITLKDDFVSQYFSKDTSKKEIAKRVQHSVDLVERKIPELLDEIGVDIEGEIDEVVLAAVKKYCSEREE